MQRKLLLYLMQCEIEQDKARAEVDFKNILIVHRPDLYDELYKKSEEPTEVDEFLPETEGDVQKMLKMLRRQGIG